eukprot:1470527-Alexandrium_andersonii.AAC.1
MPLSFSGKVRVINGKVIPQSMYGAPAAPVSKVAIRNLTSAIAAALDPKAAGNRSQQLALLLATLAAVEPAAHVLLMRIKAMRRTWH